MLNDLRLGDIIEVKGERCKIISFQNDCILYKSKIGYNINKENIEEYKLFSMGIKKNDNVDILIDNDFKLIKRLKDF